MALQPLSSDNSQSSNLNQINNMVRQLNRDQTTKVFKQSNGTDGLISGVLPNSEGYGELLYDSSGNARLALRIKNDQPSFKISKSGFNVLTATSDQLIFNSDQDIFKIVEIITFSITQPAASSNAYSKPHGLSFVPAVMGFLAAGGGLFRPLPTRTTLTLDTVNGNVNMNTWVEVQADATNVTINFWNATASPVGNYNFKVYVLQETAQ